jgi:hypothetical protein
VGCKLVLSFRDCSAVCCHSVPTFFRTLEADVELLHVVVDQSDFVVTHQHLHDVGLDSALWAGHCDGVVLVLTGSVWWSIVWRGNQVFAGLWVQSLEAVFEASGLGGGMR